MAEGVETNKEIVRPAGSTIKDFYKLGRTLGEGTFAKVKVCTDLVSKEKLAVKIIERAALSDSDEDALKTEIKILFKVQHPNIVGVREVFYSSKQVNVVMDLMAGGELFDRIVATESGYSEKDAKKALVDICVAIKYCHEKEIVHRDLKPENILYASAEPDAALKLADFGLAELLQPGELMNSQCGTPGYVAPEVLRGEYYGKEVDMWSIGVILYVLLCGFPPFYDENNKKLYEKILNGMYDFPTPYWDEVSEDAKDLVRNLMKVDRSQRFTADQVLQHPWCMNEANDKVLAHANLNLKKYNARRRLRGAIRAVMIANHMKM